MNDHHSTPREADGGSNGAIYDREWASFVDSIITRWTPLPDSEDTATQKSRQTAVCLRDLMQLEEVLVKLRKEEREGFTLSGDGSHEKKKDHLVMVTGRETFPRHHVAHNGDESVPRERQRKPLRTITVCHLSAGNRINTVTNCSWETSSIQKLQSVNDRCDLITSAKTARVGDKVQPSCGTGPSRNNSDGPLSPRVAVSHRELLVETYSIPDETNVDPPSGLSGATLAHGATKERDDDSTISSRRLDVGPVDGPLGGERGSRITPKIVEVVGGKELSKGETDTSRTNCNAAYSGMEQGIQKLQFSAGGDNSHGSEMNSKPNGPSSIPQKSPGTVVAERLHAVDKRSCKGVNTTSGDSDVNVIAPHEASRGTGTTHSALLLSSSRTVAGEGLSRSTFSRRSDSNGDESLAFVREVDTGVRTLPSGNLPSAMDAEKCSVTPPISNGTGERAKSPKAPSSPSPSSLSSTTPVETPKGGSLDATMLDNSRTDSRRLDSSVAACAKGMRSPLDQSWDIDRTDGDSEVDSGAYFLVALENNECTSLEVAQMPCSSASRVISEDDDPEAMPGIHETSKDQTSAGSNDVTRIDPDIDGSRVSDEGVGHALLEMADPHIVGFAGSSAAGHESNTRTGSGVVLDSCSHCDDACGFADEISTESPEMIRSYSGYHASSKAAANFDARTKFGFGGGPVAQLGVKQDVARGGEGIPVGDEWHSPPAKIKTRGVPVADEMFESDGLSPGILEFDFDGGEAVSPITLSSLEEEGSCAEKLRSPSGNDSIARSNSESTLATDASLSPDAAVPRTIGAMQSPYQVMSDAQIAISEDNGSTQYPGTSSQETGEDHSRPAGRVQGPESDPGAQGYPLPRSARGTVPQESEHDAKSPQNIHLLETREKEHDSMAGSPVVRNDIREWDRGRAAGSSSKSLPTLESPYRGSRGMVAKAIDDGETGGHQKTSPLPRQTPFCPVIESLEEEAEAGAGASQIKEDKSSPRGHDDLDERWGDVGDVSLLEGTPRRGGGGIGSGSGDLSGFYAPLSMTYRTKTHRDDTLSTEQSITLEWMLWREGRTGRDGIPTAGDMSGGAHDDTDMVVNGGILGHLDWSGAMECAVALIQKSGGGEAGERSRPGELEASTGLPKGATLIVSSSRQAAREWSDRVAACCAGLSVLEYVMPLRERRRLSARQVAAFDVVVTTYDVLRAREVPQTGAEEEFASESNSCIARNSRGKGDGRDKNGKDGKSEWLSRRAPKEVLGTRCRDSQAKMTSTLQQVWWRRVVVDGAEILAKRRSTRADTLLQLPGEVRWCVIARENMGFIENASERMRSLTHFLRIPSEMPLVEAAPYLFFNDRPPGVAPKVGDKCILFPSPGYLGSCSEGVKGCFRSLPRTQSYTLDKEDTSGRSSPEVWRLRGGSRHSNDARGGCQPQLPKRSQNRTPSAIDPPGEAHTIHAEGLRESSAHGAPASGSTPITHITFQREKVVYNETRLHFRRVQVDK